MMQNILLFGGTFDPVHNGHVSLLQNAHALVSPDKTLVIPAALPPHKDAAKTSGALRLAMCEALAAAVPGGEVEPMELLRGGRSYTIDTVHTLMQNYPNARFYFCMGGDMLLYFTEWREWQTLLACVTLVVQNRQDADMRAVRLAATARAAKGGRVLLTKAEPAPLSSTAVREALCRGADITQLVPPQVAKMIAQHQLYSECAQQ